MFKGWLGSSLLFNSYHPSKVREFFSAAASGDDPSIIIEILLYFCKCLLSSWAARDLRPIYAPLKVIRSYNLSIKLFYRFLLMFLDLENIDDSLDVV
jgi:hypothetical protein